MKNISWRTPSVIAVILVALVYVFPTFKPTLWPHKQINLGLDLQGGMHLVLEVETDKAVSNRIERAGQDLRRQMKIDRIKHDGVDLTENKGLTVKLKSPEDKVKFDVMLDKEFKDLRINSGEDDMTVRLDLPDQESDAIKRLAVDQALELSLIHI